MLLKMNNISKSFSGTQALNKVTFNLKKGEVRALMGENGAGKSTLMKILTGIYRQDSGEIYLNNEKVMYNNTREAQEDGVVMVHQELNLMEDLRVYENIFIGREDLKNGFLIDDEKLMQKTSSIFDELGVDIDPSSKVGDLTVGQQQIVEIAKAISMKSQIIVFDEPTAALSNKEIEELFNLIKDLKSKGVGIVYISHRMEEIKQISDTITVLRDGCYIGTERTENVSQSDIIRMMVGRSIPNVRKQKAKKLSDQIVLEVKNLKSGRRVKDVNFTLRRGEILGIAGLMGSGRTEAMRAIFGADQLDKGEVLINGEKVDIKNTEEAVKLGLAYASEDRRRYGVLLDEPIYQNIVINNLDNDTKHGLISNKSSIKRSSTLIDKLTVKCQSPKQIVKDLSGGNQQKVVIAKWLAKDAEIIIFDEPTRGIDIGAKTEIYKLMEQLSNEGKSIIMISSELPEILRMSDRIVVFSEGITTGELDIEEATQEKIMELATRVEGDKIYANR